MMLSDGIIEYVARKRLEKVDFQHGESILNRLSRQLGAVALHDVSTSDVTAYLGAQVLSTNTWAVRHQTLSRFFEYWSVRGIMHGSVMPPGRRQVRSRFIPYIYSRAELRLLLQAAARTCTRGRSLAPQTMKTFVFLLYATGAMIGEILSLKDSDVNLSAGTLTITSKRSYATRTIPIGRDLRQILEAYRRWRLREGLGGDNFLCTKNNRRLSATSVVVYFDRMRRAAGLAQDNSSGKSPRLNDLKYTFAVHRITSWVGNRASLSRMLPALAAYMGQVGLGATERYLSLTPERFRKDLDRLSPMHGKRRWRDDPELMSFLNSLGER